MTRHATEPFLMVAKTLAARRDLPPGAKLLLAVIVDRARGRGFTWAGTRRLARDIGMGRNAITKNIARLVAAGLVNVETRGCGSGCACRYTPTGPETGPVENTDRPGKRAGGENQPARKAGTRWPGKRAATGPESGPQERKEPLKENGAPAPQGPSEPEPVGTGGDGATGRVVTAWLDGFGERVGERYPQSQVKALAGRLKNALGDFHEDRLTRAVGAWFGADRPDFGVGLFLARLAGGNVELLGRPAAPSPLEAEDLTEEEAEERFPELFGPEAQAAARAAQEAGA